MSVEITPEALERARQTLDRMDEIVIAKLQRENLLLRTLAECIAGGDGDPQEMARQTLRELDDSTWRREEKNDG